jgi:hypothetical protein
MVTKSKKSATKKASAPKKGNFKLLFKNFKKSAFAKFVVEKRNILIPVVTFLVPTLFFMIGGYSKTNLAMLRLLDSDVLSPAKAESYTQAYIASEILPGQEFYVDDIKDLGLLYSFTITIPSQGQYTSYITKNGRMLFTSGYDASEFKNAVLSGDVAIEEEKAESPTVAENKSDRPEVQLFLMSFCPYGNQAEEIIMPVAELLADSADVVPHYIVSKSGSTYSSLHGEQELNQDVRELCVYKYQPELYWDFLKQINADCTYENADTCWTASAQKVGINVATISQCQQQEAEALLDQEIAATTEYQVTGSPTLVINGTIYNGNRTSEAYKEAVCNAFNNAPDECSATLEETTKAAQGGC